MTHEELCKIAELVFSDNLDARLVGFALGKVETGLNESDLIKLIWCKGIGITIKKVNDFNNYTCKQLIFFKDYSIVKKYFSNKSYPENKMYRIIYKSNYILISTPRRNINSLFTKLVETLLTEDEK